MAETVGTCARFFSLQEPRKADADGLIDCLGDALGITNVRDKASVLGAKPLLIGGGTDGNVSAQNGMMGKLQQVCPWIFWAWCFAHRLKLACKDALSSQLFKDLDDMLLRLYFLYSKSPKKSRELSDIIEDLKEVFEFPKGGSLPIRSQGSRWINHKRRALQRFVDWYGVYINHLLTLVEDRMIRSDDRAKLKGYLQKWRQARILIGAALYVDLLKSPVLALVFKLNLWTLSVVSSQFLRRAS